LMLGAVSVTSLSDIVQILTVVLLERPILKRHLDAPGTRRPRL
jgi:hypothetical protein